MIVFNISTKACKTTIEVYVVFITLVWVEGFTSWVEASDGRHIKKSGYQHPTGELESVSHAFLEVQESDQNILAVGRTSPRQLDKVEDTSLFPKFTLFPSILFK